jgi:Ni,Fe-hydrogenase III large subunit
VLIIVARTGGGPGYPEMIEEMDQELTKVIDDFDRAVNVEALRLANKTGKLSFSRSIDSWSSGVRRRASGARASRARDFV